jgi:ferric-dicitrate binding protein FerR (iron transport regulator)
MTGANSSSPADAELDAIIALLKEKTAAEPSAAAAAAVLAAAPTRRRFGMRPIAALAACAVLGLVMGFGASRFAPSTEEQALDAVIAASFVADAYGEAPTDG